jgi:hypothetical protein
MKHTPGPWYEANTGNHQGLVISENSGKNVCVTYDKSDAALISAAPEMLEALKLAKDVFDNMTSSDFSQGKDKSVRNKIDATIAKAEVF